MSARYLFKARASKRYTRKGFVIERCPACREGTLTLEGTGGSHWVVRCDNCRSVLRQTRDGLWRYAADPLPDKEFADKYNGQVLSEAELVELARKRASRQRVTGD